MRIREIGPIGFFLLMSIASLLPGWGVSLLARHDEYSSYIAKLSCAAAWSADVPMQEMVVSSATIYTDSDTTDVGKSFVNIEKSVGSKTDHCGMPYDTGVFLQERHLQLSLAACPLGSSLTRPKGGL